MSCRVGPAAENRTRSSTSLLRRPRLLLAGCLLLLVAVPAFYYLVVALTRPAATPCPLALSVPLPDARSLPDGGLQDRGDVYPAGYHFSSGGTPRGCLCRLKPCIRKCCARDEYLMSLDDKPDGQPQCARHSGPTAFDNFTLPVYTRPPSEYANVSQDHFRILYGDSCAYGKYVLDPKSEPDDVNYLLSDGTVRMADEPPLDASQYCLEALNDVAAVRTFVCFPPPEDSQTRAMFTWYPVGMILSTPFLVATFAVYALIAELRNLHGKALMCHVTSLTIAYVALTVVQLGREVPSIVCIVLAFIVQFSFLATFFWLNTMCFDIWWVFSGLRPLRGSVKDTEHKKFIMYSLYAWGGPTVILIITLVMELVPSIPNSFIKPRFGVDKCWFKEANAVMLYFYLPIAVLLLLNIVMFVTTAIRLRAHTRDTKVLHSSESRRNDDSDRQRLNLYLKLFIVMGINWVMELVSFFVGGSKYIWFVTDIGNTLQGLLIFIIFVWKRRILRLLNQRLCPGLELAAQSTTSTRSKVSSLRTSSSSLSKTISNNPEGAIRLKSSVGETKPITRQSDESDSNN